MRTKFDKLMTVYMRLYAKHKKVEKTYCVSPPFKTYTTPLHHHLHPPRKMTRLYSIEVDYSNVNSSRITHLFQSIKNSS